MPPPPPPMVPRWRLYMSADYYSFWIFSSLSNFQNSKLRLREKESDYGWMYGWMYGSVSSQSSFNIRPKIEYIIWMWWINLVDWITKGPFIDFTIHEISSARPNNVLLSVWVEDDSAKKLSSYLWTSGALACWSFSWACMSRNICQHALRMIVNGEQFEKGLGLSKH